MLKSRDYKIGFKIVRGAYYNEDKKYKKIKEYEIKRKRLILKIPFSIARVMAATNDFFRLILGDVVPAFLTLAQVKSLEKDNLVGSNSEKFSDFGIVPKNLKIVLPTIVGRYNKS